MASAIEADGTSWNFRDETKLQGGGVARDGGGGRAGHAQGDGPAQLVDDVVPSGAKSSSHDHDSNHAHDDQRGASTAKFSDDGSQVLQRDVSEGAVPRLPLAASDLAMQVSLGHCDARISVQRVLRCRVVHSLHLCFSVLHVHTHTPTHTHTHTHTRTHTHAHKHSSILTHARHNQPV